MRRGPLLAHDPAVPTRDRLLDCAEMKWRLAGHLSGLAATQVRAVRAKYRVGEGLRVVYRVGDGPEATIVSARTAPVGGHPSTVRASSVRPPAFEDADLGASFWVFPGDRRLVRAGELRTPPADLVSRLGRSWVRSRLAGYVPEKCAVFACLGTDDRVIAYAKVFASSEDATRAFELHDTVWRAAEACADLALPRPLGLDTQRHLVFTQAAPGLRLTDVPRASVPGALRQLGAAVARFHALPLPRDAPRFDRLAPRAIRRAAEVIGRARPFWGDTALRLADRLEASMPLDTNRVALLHGDLHFKNAFLAGGRSWLIDLDQVSAGSPAADIGSFLALLRSHARVGLLSTSDEGTLARSFKEGYARVHALPDASAIDWHTAAALLAERGLRAVNRLRLRLLNHLDDLLADAWRLSRKAGGR